MCTAIILTTSVYTDCPPGVWLHLETQHNGMESSLCLDCLSGFLLVSQGAVEFYGGHGKEVTHARALVDHARDLVYDEANKDLIIRYAGLQETTQETETKVGKGPLKTISCNPGGMSSINHNNTST